ncbi:hypothetical protein AB0B79_02095 [Streptomyces sp. NPDC039022]|uniref:hypothetical protein n=1 Tax=unclassified Streptomyces TaxID=2593676 RepID=UPI0033D1085A
MSTASGLRLLPWSGPNGRRCYVATDGTPGFVSRLADSMEEAQLNIGEELLDHAGRLLDDPKASSGELHFLARRLREARVDALRVADSRGERIPDRDDDDEPDDDLEDSSRSTEEPT